MQTPYDHYLLGCRQAGVRPLNFWRFSVAYAKYRREFRHALDKRVSLVPAKGRERVVGQWMRLVRLADLVEAGQEIAARASRFPGGDDEPGAAGAGAREPRTPLAPVLSGCAARPLPGGNAVKQNNDWRL